MSRPVVLTGLLLAACAVSPAFAAEDRNAIERAEGDAIVWSGSVGVEQSKSEIIEGVEQKITYVPVTVGFAVGGWSVGVESGWIKGELDGTIGGRTYTLPSIAGRPARTIQLTNPTTISRSVDGVADTTVFGRYDFAPIADRVAFALSADVKLPTADEESQLGSGETDYAVSGEVAGLGRFAPYLGVGYQVLGEPDGVSYDNPVFGYVGFDVAATDVLEFGATYDYAQSPIDAVDDTQSVTGVMRWRATDHLRLDFTAAAGLSDAAPDSTFGLRLSVRS